MARERQASQGACASDRACGLRPNQAPHSPSRVAPKTANCTIGVHDGRVWPNRSIAKPGMPGDLRSENLSNS